MRLPLSRIAGFLLFVFLLLPPLVWGQSTTSFLQTKSFQFNSRSIPVQIKLDSFVPGTERLIFDSTIVLRDSVDYVAEPKKGLIELVGPTWKRMENDSAAHTIQIFYRPQLILARREFTSKSVVLEKDSTQHTRIVQSVAPSAESASDIFGKGLQKSGSIARGFTVATNRDLTLNSGFRLQLNGKLNEEVDVAAALTDENTPIQPEGTTQTLREVDRVFVELKSKEYAATLGDFSVQRGGAEAGEFAHVNRKIQGAQGVGSFTNLLGSDINVLASAEAGVVRGKFTTNQFQGMEGTQGPYRLIGKNGEQHPIVVAGSERVYINGELQTRGEVNDYVIDYAAGEITFTPKHLVTSASRIAIDFEYTDRQYTRNLLGGSLNVRSTDNSFRLNASVLQEADDENSPIDFNLDQNARTILSESGGDRLRASLPGGRLVGRDSASGLAKGQYAAKDTLINGKKFSYYVYAPGDSLALYLVDFTAVDSIPEDSLGYDRVSVGHFRVAGLGRGGYLPLVILPQPKLHRILAINSEVELGKNIFVGAEYAGSTLEQNRFSSDPRSRLNGGALKLNTRMLPTQVSVGAFALGKLGFSAAHRRVDGTFRSTDRFNEVEFDRKWNAASINTVAEEINEVSTMYSPLSALSAAVEYGTLKREGESESRRLGSEIAFADSNKPYVRYKREFISSTKLLNDMSSSWIRERGDGTYDLGVVIPEVRVERESKQSRLSNRDSLFGESYSFLETAAKVTARQTGAVSASAEFQVRSADSALGGIAMPAFNSFTQLYGVQVTSWKSVSTSLQLNLRRVEFDPKFQRRGNQNTEVVLVRSQTRMTPLDRSIETDLFYEFSNQRSARMERIFVRVQKGTGTYRYKGDVNGNGQPDDNEFEQTRFDGDYVAVYVPGETLVPVLDVKASLRLRLTPSRLIRFPATAMEKLLTLFSSETYARVDEKSTEEDEKQIYLLNFSRFQNSRTTITGATVFTQDVYYNESSPEFSLRLRYGERRGMTQLISASERTLQQERSLRIRSQLVREIGNTTDIGMRTDRSVASTASPRDRNLEIISLQSNFSYRPEREWEIEFQLGLSNTRDTFAERNVVSNINEQAIRIGYGFAGTGQVRAEVRREDVVLQGNSYPTGVMPYEFTAGKSLGKSFFWQLSTDYRITSFIQLTINYFGRSESGRAVVHTATAEARAFF